MTKRQGWAWRVLISSHKCGWPGCETQVAGRLWACKHHWMRLPVEIRDRLMGSQSNQAEALAWIEQEEGGVEDHRERAG